MTITTPPARRPRAPLDFALGADRHGRPLATARGFIGHGAEFTLDDLLALAAEALDVARAMRAAPTPTETPTP